MENVQKAVQQADNLFGKFLNFQHGPVIVDARKSWGHGMGELRCLLANVAQEVLRKAPLQAALCNDIQRALPWIRATVGGPIISRKALPELAARGLRSKRRQSVSKSVIQSHADLLDAALRQMSDACEILSFDTPELKDVLVINPPWLLHDVVGVLLSPDKFPSPRVQYDKNGRSKRKLAERALTTNFGQLLGQFATLEMLAELGLCILDKDQCGTGDDEEIVVPSKLQVCRHLQGILSFEGHVIWFGVELLCSEVPLSVCLFPQLQVHLHNYFLTECKQKPIMWSGGIAVALPHEQVVGIVEARHGRMGIDLIVQATEETRRTGFCLLQILKEQTRLKVQLLSPGSDITEMVLSSRELSSLDWSKSHRVPKVTYNRSFAENAIEHGQVRPDHEDESLRVLEDAFSLMAIPPTHLCLMTSDGYKRFCHEITFSSSSGEKTDKWQELGRRLGIPQHELPTMDFTSTSNPADVMLQCWSRRSGKNTINRLLAAVKSMHHPEAEAILEKELNYSLSILPGKPKLSPILQIDCESSDGHDRDDGSPRSSCPSRSSKCHSSQAHTSDHNPLHNLVHESLPNPIENIAEQNSPPPFAEELISLPSSCQPPRGKEHVWSLPASVMEQSLPEACVGSRDSDSVFQAPVAGHISSSANAKKQTPPPSPCNAKGMHVVEPPPSAVPAYKQLVKVAESFDSVFECKQLAVYLKVPLGGRAISSLQSTNSRMSPQDMAYEVLLTWRRKQGRAATSKELQRVLSLKMRKVNAVEAVWPLDAAQTTSGNPGAGPHSMQAHPEISKRAHSSTGQVPETTIMDIALSPEFSNEYSCKQLAVYLDIWHGSRFVENLSSHADNHERAYEVMMEWKKEKGSAATGEWLYKVLHDELNMKDLAENFEKSLCGSCLGRSGPY